LSKDNVESVLTFRRNRLGEIGLFQGISFEVERYLKGIAKQGCRNFIRRDEAENDKSLKQIIPYGILEHEGKILHYVRGAQISESRLAKKSSIGIGGHIIPGDGRPTSEADEFDPIYVRALRRELKEELKVMSPPELRIVALINDERNDVGKVHFGIVFTCRLSKRIVVKSGKDLGDVQFLARQELNALRSTLEPWSQLCLGEIDALLQ
jgi:predicted NUDIX family phosphoesterase